MINLEVFFKNHFDTKEISDDNLKKFTQDHIQRIVANNSSGIYNGMLNATITAYNGYFGAITDEDTKLAVQQSRTITTDNAFDAFILKVRQKEGTVRGLYGIGTAEYEEFFPHGLSEYDVASKANIETLMTRMVVASTAHQADLGVDFVTLFTDLKNNYITARTAQLQQFGLVDSSKSVTSSKRDVVEIRLSKNIMILAGQFLGNPDRANDFFDQSIIRPGETNENFVKSTVAGGVTKNLFDRELDATDEIKLKNTGTTNLIFCVTASDTDACSGGVIVNAGEEQTVNVSDLGDVANNTKLNVTNLNPSVEGSFEVRIL